MKSLLVQIICGTVCMGMIEAYKNVLMACMLVTAERKLIVSVLLCVRFLVLLVK